MSTRPDWSQPADERIVRYLRENPPDYVPLIANRLGMHLGYVERRVEAMVDHGMIEPVTGEVVYAVTDRGERYLAECATGVQAESDD